MVLQAVGSRWGKRGSFSIIIFIEVMFLLKPIVPIKVVCKTYAE